MLPATRELLDEVLRILAGYAQQITVRQLYYRLVAAHVIPNNLASYKRLVGFLTRWRKSGDLDPAVFVDLTREPDPPRTWADLATFLERVRESYHRDRWEGQGIRPAVWIEKEALATVFEPVCREFGVLLQVCRGYPSLSCLVEASHRRERILYFGDFDPTGVDISRNIREELEETWGAEVKLDVIALTKDQAEERELPWDYAKATDSRTKGFLADYGIDHTWELDALPPDVLETMVREAIQGEITDQEAWDQDGEREEEECEKLAEIISEFE